MKNWICTNQISEGGAKVTDERGAEDGKSRDVERGGMIDSNVGEAGVDTVAAGAKAAAEPVTGGQLVVALMVNCSSSMAVGRVINRLFATVVAAPVLRRPVCDCRLILLKREADAAAAENPAGAAGSRKVSPATPENAIAPPPQARSESSDAAPLDGLFIVDEEEGVVAPDGFAGVTPKCCGSVCFSWKKEAGRPTCRCAGTQTRPMKLVGV